MRSNNKGTRYNNKKNNKRNNVWGGNTTEMETIGVRVGCFCEKPMLRQWKGVLAS
jgi:hypothetical protein